MNGNRCFWLHSANRWLDMIDASTSGFRPEEVSSRLTKFDDAIRELLA